MSGSNSKNKRKCVYKGHFKSKKARYCSLTAGIQGFLLFCNQREKEAIREGYAILNQYADICFPEIHPEDSKLKSDEDNDNDDDDDLESALEKEKAQLQKSQKKENRRFQITDGSINNLLFIRCLKSIDPQILVEKIMDEIEKDGRQRTRNLLRLVPVEVVTKAFESNIAVGFKTLIQKRKSEFTEDEKMKKSYCIVYKSRYNNNLTKEEVINAINPVMNEELGSDNVLVDYKKPDFVIIVEVMKTFCCMSILKDYFTRKKFNLIEWAKVNSQGDEQLNENQNVETLNKTEKTEKMSESNNSETDISLAST